MSWPVSLSRRTYQQISSMTPPLCIFSTSPYWMPRVPTDNAHGQCSLLLVIYLSNDSQRFRCPPTTQVRLLLVFPLPHTSGLSHYMIPSLHIYDVSPHVASTGTRPNTLPPLVINVSWKSNHISSDPMVSPNTILTHNHSSLWSTSSIRLTKHVNSHMVTQPTDHSPYAVASHGKPHPCTRI